MGIMYRVCTAMRASQYIINPFVKMHCLELVLLILNSAFCSSYGRLLHHRIKETVPAVMYNYTHTGFQVQSHSDFECKGRIYDFIIVGAGPAGSVLARRLSENRSWNILLIEAGGIPTITHDIPIIAAYLQSTSSNWNYKSVPQKFACFGMVDHKCSLPRGKVLGGTSAINYMIYNRGNKNDFDQWARFGNKGWSYKDVLPYFLKSEGAKLKIQNDSQYHSAFGPLSVEDVPYKTKMVKAFIQAGKEIGLEEIDYNGRKQLGIAYVQANILQGHRHSASKAFLEPIIERPNLQVITESRVIKILVNPKTKNAYGIEFVNSKKKYTVFSKKEVILSAGAFNSPQILILSGIGPAAHLKDLRIPVLNNLPVGSTLFDHVSHFGPTFILNSTGNTPFVSKLSVNDWMDFKKGKGLLTLIGGVESLVFLKTSNSMQPVDVPDIELIFVAGSFASDEGTGLKRAANLKDNVYESVYQPLEKLENDHFSILVMLFHPRSKGYLKLRDNNPFHWPIIDPQYFSEKADVEAILDGIKMAIKICSSPTMKKLGVRIHDAKLPQCMHFLFGTDDYWRCSINTLTYTLHHQVATCKMGLDNDTTSVVNPRLLVHGMKNLRVVDTSIIPFPTTSHTNAASVMIGEKAADLIKSSWIKASMTADGD